MTVISLIFSACSASDVDPTDYLPYTAYIDVSEVEELVYRADVSRRYSYLWDDDNPAPQSTTFSANIMGIDYTANYDSM